MSFKLLRIALGVASFLIGSLFAIAQEPPPPADPADDPLPDGAKTRFGVTRPILRSNPAVGLIAPKYMNFLAPTMTGGVRRYDLGTGRPFTKATKISDVIGPGAVVVSLDGKRAAVVRPGLVSMVDANTGKELFAVKPPEGVIIAGSPGVSLSADGNLLAYCGRGADGKGVVVVWDMEKSEVVAKIETAQAAPVFPLLSADGQTLVTHGPPLSPPMIRDPNAPAPPMPKAEMVDPDAARTAQVWEVSSGKELFRARVTGMGGMAVASAFSPDGSMLALSAGDGPVDLFDVKTGKRVQTLLGRKGQGVKVAFSLDGKLVASIGPDFRIQRWTVQGKPLDVTDSPPGLMNSYPLTGLAFADNERVIAWMTASQFVVAWEAPVMRLLSPQTDHIAAIRSISIPPQPGKDLFTSGTDGRINRWDLATGLMNEAITLRPARLPGQPMIRPVVTLSADATRAAWLRNPTEIFDLDFGAEAFCVPAPSAPQSPVAFALSPDGTKLLVMSKQADAKRGGACVVWDLATQQRVAEFEISGSETATAPGGALSQDARRLVVISMNRGMSGKSAFTVTGFDVKTGKKLGEVEDPAAIGTMAVTVADDTSAVVAASTGRIWTVNYVEGQLGKDIDRLTTRGEVLTPHIVFSPDGKRFATGVQGIQFETYGVRVYDWPSGKTVRTFMGHVGPVTALRFSADSNTLASGAQDASVLLWDLTKVPEKK